jgi:hypothetical protein
MTVTDVIFEMIAIALVLVAFAAAFVGMRGSPTVRRITTWVIYGCAVAALGSVMLARWFMFQLSP